MRLVFCLISFLSLNLAYGQINLDWVAAFNANDYQTVQNIEVDNAGNVYVKGYFNDSVDFNPGPVDYYLTSDNWFQMFYAKYNLNGDLVWAKKLDGFSNGGYYDTGGLSVDVQGNVIITDGFSGSVDMDPNWGTLTFTDVDAGSMDWFIAKYNPNGSLSWAKQIVTTASQNNILLDSDVDNQGNIYITGSIRDSVNFDPNGSYWIDPASSSEMFLAKYSPNGDLIWVFTSEGIGASTWGRALTLYNDSVVCVSGLFDGSVDLNPQVGIGPDVITSVNMEDAFIVSYDSSGNFKWVTSFGGSDVDAANDIVSDNQGNIYGVGWFFDTVDFDPGPATDLLVSNAYSNGYVTKYNSAGDYQWAKQFGCTGTNKMEAIDSDEAGNIYIIGPFEIAVDLDPGAGVANHATNGMKDLALSALDNNGDYLFSMHLGGTVDDFLGSVAIGSDGTIHIGGIMQDAVNFNPQGLPNIINGATAWNGFIAKYDSPISAVEEFNYEGNILIYPNPADQVVHIVSESDKFNSILVCDHSGRIIYSNHYKGNEYTVDMSQFQSGVYTIQLTGNSGIYIRRVILNH